MKIDKCAIVKSLELDDDKMAKINAYTLKELTAEEVFAFKMVACDNEIDRDYEAFSGETLEQLAELYKGKTVISDHNPQSTNQCARIFDAEVITSPGETTKTGEEYKQLVLHCYCIKATSGQLIAEIEGGIKKECSVGCSVKSAQCSICGGDARRCEHYRGKRYDGALCFYKLVGAVDAYEVSFVAVPAQRAAGVTKEFEGEEPPEEKEKSTDYTDAIRIRENFIYMEESKMNKKMRDLLAKIKSKTEEARQHNEAGEVDLVKACLDEVDNLKGEYETEKRLFEAEQDELDPEEHGDNGGADLSEEKSFVEYLRKAASAGMSQGSNGAIIPKTIANKIITDIVNVSPIIEKATKYYTKGALSIPVYGTDASADSPTGDIAAAYQGDEFTALTAGQGKFTSVDLSGYVLGALTVISNKLINNTDINIVSKVEELMTEAFRVKLERELIHGTSGKMTGAVSTTNKMTLTTYTLAGITFDVLIEMQAMIPQIYQSNAMWIMSNKTFTALRKTKNSQNEYLMKDIETGFGWKILGSPVYISDAMDEATKQEGYPVLYGDFSGMALKIAKQLELQVLNEKYADKNAKGVVGWLEADSKVENNQKIAVLQSGKQNG